MGIFTYILFVKNQPFMLENIPYMDPMGTKYSSQDVFKD